MAVAVSYYRGGSMKKTLALVAVCSLVLVGCSWPKKSSDSPNAKKSDSTMMGQSQTMQGENAQIEVQQNQMMKAVTVTASNYSYDVREIRAKKGENLKVLFINQEGMHDFVIDDLNVKSGTVMGGNSVELSIPTDVPGTYEYYCSIGDHKARGMVGKVIIE